MSGGIVVGRRIPESANNQNCRGGLLLGYIRSSLLFHVPAPFPIWAYLYHLTYTMEYIWTLPLVASRTELGRANRIATPHKSGGHATQPSDLRPLFINISFINSPIQQLAAFTTTPMPSLESRNLLQTLVSLPRKAKYYLSTDRIDSWCQIKQLVAMHITSIIYVYIAADTPPGLHVCTTVLDLGVCMCLHYKGGRDRAFSFIHTCLVWILVVVVVVVDDGVGLLHHGLLSSVWVVGLKRELKWWSWAS